MKKITGTRCKRCNSSGLGAKPKKSLFRSIGMKKNDVSSRSVNKVDDNEINFEALRAYVDMVKMLKCPNKTKIIISTAVPAKPTKLGLEKFKLGADLTISDWGYKAKVSAISATDSHISTEIEGYFYDKYEDFVPMWEKMFEAMVPSLDDASNEIAYETFSRSIVNPETFISELKELIAEIYQIDKNSVEARYEVFDKDGMTKYFFNFSEKTVVNHDLNLRLLKIRDEAIMIRLEKEALKPAA